MKKITFIAILLLCICSLTKAKEKVIEQPPFIAWTSTSIQVDKVVLSDTATVLYIKAFYHPKQWIRICFQDMGHSAERQSPPGTFVTSRSHRT